MFLTVLYIRYRRTKSSVRFRNTLEIDSGHSEYLRTRHEMATSSMIIEMPVKPAELASEDMIAELDGGPRIETERRQ